MRRWKSKSMLKWLLTLSFLFVGAKKLSKIEKGFVIFLMTTSSSGKNSHNSQEFWNSIIFYCQGAGDDHRITKWWFIGNSLDIGTLSYLIFLLNHICKYLYYHLRSESRCELNWPDSIWTRNVRMNSWYSLSLCWLDFLLVSGGSYSKSSEIERVLNVNIPEIVYSRKARV